MPENVPQELKPSLQFIRQLCEKFELVSFSHKKKALEGIKELIIMEIQRKQFGLKFEKNFNTIGLYMEALEGQQNQFTEENEQDALLKTNEKVLQYKMLIKLDPAKAQLLMGARAKQYMLDWSEEHYDETKATKYGTDKGFQRLLQQWNGDWKQLEQIEENIMKEERYYKRDMKFLVIKQRKILEGFKEKAFFQIEALEEAILQTKLDRDIQVSRLQMQLADYESKELRNNRNSDNQNQQSSKIIQNFLQTTPTFASVKEANKWIMSLKEPIRDLFQGQILLKNEYESMKIDYDLLNGKVKSLEDQCKTQDSYFKWLDHIVDQSFNPLLPKNYITLEQKKNLELFRENKVFNKHFLILESQGIESKIIDDIELSKVFSIIGFSVFEMLTNIGLLKAKLETVKSTGGNKFRLETQMLVDLYNMFKNPTVGASLTKLANYRDDLRRVKKLFCKESNVKEEIKKTDDSDEENINGVEEQILNGRFRKLQKGQIKVFQSQTNMLLEGLNLNKSQADEFKEELDTFQTLGLRLNTILKQESTVITQIEEDQTPVGISQADERKYALIEKRQRLQDLVVFQSDRIYLDMRRLTLYFFDFATNETQTNLSVFGIEIKKKTEPEMFKEFTNFFNSILLVNKMLAGTLSFAGRNSLRFYDQTVQQNQLIQTEYQKNQQNQVQSPNQNSPRQYNAQSSFHDRKSKKGSTMQLDNNVQQEIEDLENQLTLAMTELQLRKQQMEDTGLKFNQDMMNTLVRQASANRPSLTKYSSAYQGLEQNTPYGLTGKTSYNEGPEGSTHPFTTGLAQQQKFSEQEDVLQNNFSKSQTPQSRAASVLSKRLSKQVTNQQQFHGQNDLQQIIIQDLKKVSYELMKKHSLKPVKQEEQKRFLIDMLPLEMKQLFNLDLKQLYAEHIQPMFEIKQQIKKEEKNDQKKIKVLIKGVEDTKIKKEKREKRNVDLRNRVSSLSKEDSNLYMPSLSRDPTEHDQFQLDIDSLQDINNRHNFSQNDHSLGNLILDCVYEMLENQHKIVAKEESVESVSENVPEPVSDIIVSQRAPQPTFVRRASVAFQFHQNFAAGLNFKKTAQTQTEQQKNKKEVYSNLKGDSASNATSKIKTVENQFIGTEQDFGNSLLLDTQDQVNKKLIKIQRPTISLVKPIALQEIYDGLQENEYQENGLSNDLEFDLFPKQIKLNKKNLFNTMRQLDKSVQRQLNNNKKISITPKEENNLAMCAVCHQAAQGMVNYMTLDNFESKKPVIITPKESSFVIRSRIGNNRLIANKIQEYINKVNSPKTFRFSRKQVFPRNQIFNTYQLSPPLSLSIPEQHLSFLNSNQESMRVQTLGSPPDVCNKEVCQTEQSEVSIQIAQFEDPKPYFEESQPDNHSRPTTTDNHPSVTEQNQSYLEQNLFQPQLINQQDNGKQNEEYEQYIKINFLNKPTLSSHAYLLHNNQGNQTSQYDDVSQTLTNFHNQSNPKNRSGVTSMNHSLLEKIEPNELSLNRILSKQNIKDQTNPVFIKIKQNKDLNGFLDNNLSQLTNNINIGQFGLVLSNQQESVSFKSKQQITNQKPNRDILDTILQDNDNLKLNKILSIQSSFLKTKYYEKTLQSRADSGEDLSIAERTSRIFKKGKLSFLASPESKELFVNMQQYQKENQQKHYGRVKSAIRGNNIQQFIQAQGKSLGYQRPKSVSRNKKSLI